MIEQRTMSNRISMLKRPNEIDNVFPCWPIPPYFFKELYLEFYLLSMYLKGLIAC